MALTTLNEVFGNMLTTTFANQKKRLFDLISQAAVALHWFHYKGRRKTYTGGTTIRVPLMVAYSDSGGSTSGWDPLNINPPGDVFTIAEYRMRTEYQAISITDDQMTENDGPSRIIPFIEAILENGRLSMVSRLARKINGDGTGNLGKDMDGLGLHLPVNVMGAGALTVGRRDPIANTDWRSVSIQYGPSGTNLTGIWNGEATGAPANLGISAATVSATNGIVKAFTRTYNRLTFGSVKPDVIICDEGTYNSYEEVFLPLKRFYMADTRLVDAGFVFLDFKGVPVMFDRNIQFNYAGSGISASATNTGGAYFINSEFIHLGVVSNRNFYMKPWQSPVDRLGVTSAMVLKGNIVASDRGKSGLLHSIPTF